MQKLISFRQTWRGINAAGLLCEGHCDAIKKLDCYHFLIDQNITPLSIKPSILLFQRTLLSKKNCTEFFQQLRQLLSAGISLIDSLKLMSRRPHHALQTFCMEIHAALDKGSSFCEALKKNHIKLPNTILYFINAAEQSGQLNKALDTLESFFQQQCQHQQQIKKALVYPGFLFTIACLITVGLLLFVIPQFKNIYSSLHANLPWLTKQLLQLSQFVQHHTLSIFMSIILFTSFAYKFKHRLHQLPLLCRWYYWQHLTQWLNTLQLTYNAGIPLVQSLKLSGHVVANTVLQKPLHQLINDILMGHSLSNACNRAAFLPADYLSLIHNGEVSGTLLQTIHYLTSDCQQRYQHQLECLSKWLEPVIIVVVAGMLGAFIIAMYLPILQLGKFI